MFTSHQKETSLSNENAQASGETLCRTKRNEELDSPATSFVV